MRKRQGPGRSGGKAAADARRDAADGAAARSDAAPLRYAGGCARLRTQGRRGGRRRARRRPGAHGRRIARRALPARRTLGVRRAVACSCIGALARIGALRTGTRFLAGPKHRLRPCRPNPSLRKAAIPSAPTNRLGRPGPLAPRHRPASKAPRHRKSRPAVLCRLHRPTPGRRMRLRLSAPPHRAQKRSTTASGRDRAWSPRPALR